MTLPHIELPCVMVVLLQACYFWKGNGRSVDLGERGGTGIVGSGRRVWAGLGGVE